MADTMIEAAIADAALRWGYDTWPGAYPQAAELANEEPEIPS